MKIAILSDTHFGARSDSEYFYNQQLKFFHEVFFPYLKEHNITQVIQLGDLFDRRKYINYSTLYKVKLDIFDYMQTEGIAFNGLIGNHCIYHRQSNLVNSPSLVLNEYENVHIVDEFETINFDGTDIDFVAWLNDENTDRVLDKISKSKSVVCVGHFELAGFPMYKGIDSVHGRQAVFLEDYDTVFSGHYHTRSFSGNVMYMGTPYEMTMSDYDDSKGFAIFDTSDNNVEFIDNPNTVHAKITFDRTTNIDTFDYAQYAGRIVKLIVMERTDMLDVFTERLVKQKPHELNLVELSQQEFDVDEEDIESISTLDILLKNVHNGDYQNEESMIGTIKDIFVEAESVR